MGSNENELVWVFSEGISCLICVTLTKMVGSARSKYTKDNSGEQISIDGGGDGDGGTDKRYMLVYERTEEGRMK